MEVDVVVVGGGPAGCSNALALRARGLSVAIIASTKRREKPTETAAPVLVEFLRSLGATEALHACEPCFGICSSWGRTDPTLTSSMMNPFGNAWFIHRERFDFCMQQAARLAGATWIDADAQAVDFDADGLFVKTADKSLRARWITIATGSPAWAARMTHQTPSILDSFFAVWAHVPGSLEGRLLFVEPTDYGWWYACPGDREGTIVGLVTDSMSVRALGATQAYGWNSLFQQTTLAGQLRGDISTTGVHSTNVRLAILPQKQGPRWITVGDSAMTLDPLGSSGTVTALDSGRRAAGVIADMLQGKTVNVTDGNHTAYSRWSDRLANTFYQQRIRHYAVETSRRSGSFWARREKHY